jgi:hypothetical protein
MKHTAIRLIISSILILTNTLSYSQNYYPKKIVLTGDTLVLITPLQLSRINTALLYGQRDKMVIGNLRNQLLSISELLLNRSKMERLQELKYNKLEQKLNANVVLSEHKKVVANREYKRKKKNAFLIGGGVGLVLGILLAFL